MYACMRNIPRPVHLNIIKCQSVVSSFKNTPLKFHSLTILRDSSNCYTTFLWFFKAYKVCLFLMNVQTIIKNIHKWREFTLENWISRVCISLKLNDIIDDHKGLSKSTNKKSILYHFNWPLCSMRVTSSQVNTATPREI